VPTTNYTVPSEFLTADLADPRDLVLPSLPSDVADPGLSDIAEDDDGSDPWGDLRRALEAIGSEEEEATNFEGEPPATIYGYDLSPHLQTQVAIARTMDRQAYRSLSPVSLWAIDAPTPEGYTDVHRTIESFLISANRSDGWRNLNAATLVKGVGNTYRRALNQLVEWGRIEEDSFYLVGAHSRRFRLQVKGRRCRSRVTRPGQLARIYRWIGDLADRQRDLLSDPVNRRLFESAAAIRISPADLPDFSGDLYTDEERHNLGLQVRMALTAHLRPFLRTDVSGRVYHAHTATKKEILAVATIDGERLVEFDVRASHWLSFLSLYSADSEARASDVRAITHLYESGEWEKIGGKLDRNAFLCGGKRDATATWLKRNAPHALAWFCQQRLLKGRAVYALWIQGERERARAMYQALLAAGIQTIVDKHDGFSVKASDAARAARVAQRALAEATGGIGVLTRETPVTNSEGGHRPPSMVTISDPTPKATKRPILTPVSPTITSYQTRATRLTDLADSYGIPAAHQTITRAVPLYSDVEIERAIRRASKLPIPWRAKALRSALTRERKEAA
jgi:hypothetical protein